MTIRLSLLAVTLAAVADASATPRFARSIGGPDRDIGVFAAPTRDGGYIAVGASKDGGKADDDIYLVRTDETGDVLWSRLYGGPDVDNGWSVRELVDGFVIGGFTRSFGAGGYDCYVIRTDAAGEVSWSRTYGGTGDDRCWALELTRDGGFILAGETTSTGAGAEDVLLIKLDATGDERWSRTFGGALADRGFSVVQAEDGGYVLAGQTFSEGEGDRDAYIIKTHADGSPQWSRTFGGEASDVAHFVVGTSDGHFVVTGYTTSFAPEGDDPYLIKIDSEGRTLWTRVLPLEGINHTITGVRAPDGGFYLVGFSEYRETNTTAALLVKTDADGRLGWHRDVLPTDSGRTFGYTVQSTPDGGCVFTGHTTVGSAGDLDLLLVKIDP